MWKNILWENLEIILIALLIVVPLRTFVVQPFIVHGSSMEPNFYPKDYLIIDELSYHFRDPQRYEIIVFKAPNQPSQFYIKRIIGLPNEEVEIKNGQITITTVTGKTLPIEEPFLPKNITTEGNLKIKLGPDQFFVLGDNRQASYDSRNWGPVDQDLIIGRVWLRLLPLKRVSAFTLSQPEN